MNQLNPKKLLHSKWTACHPVEKQKHFEVTRVVYDASGQVIDCRITAVHGGQARSIDWRELQSSEHWLQGWK
ncbi:TIGR02450 family Trp-rich protein [Pseudohongiella sp. SYSU M77423]|uniref:TIGR02450 family Trp-rich protein n=1 Tax=unclassified Pseudohongiella TaxID=2629611 RepID=UPI001F3B2421|nr:MULTISPECIES: TIGR02450 family Trp-rich protein [unclassified Pseudohongiella]MDH7942899.1 TIGR02450 family Trp-rich protein [Pseudohongiella sp. SYSU M77423]MEC8860646.1 TIGR02450 family Trp-rich protein [Pseudomonadota bacterium]